LTGKYNMDTYTFRINERVAIGSQALSYYQEDVMWHSKRLSKLLSKQSLTINR